MDEEVFHVPCAFNPKGAGKEMCMRMTRVARHNQDGCCAINCTSTLRICRKCVTENPNPQVAIDPVTGLCAAHSAGGDKEPQERLRLPVREVASRRAIAVPRQRRERPPEPVIPVQPAPQRAARPAQPKAPRKMPEGFRRPVEAGQLEYILRQLKADVRTFEELVKTISIERDVLLRESKLSTDARREIEEHSARLKQSLEVLLVKLRAY